MEIKNIRKTLFDKLAGTGWDDKLRFLVNSNDFDQILTKLYELYQDGRRFAPPVKDVFNLFEQTPLSKVKVVFVVPEPWPDPMINHGLAISNKLSDTKTWSLGFYRFKAELTKYIPDHHIDNGDLTFWANQGVLLLNESFTTSITTPGVHKKFWAQLTHLVIDILNDLDFVVFVFFGESDHFETIDDKHVKIKLQNLPTDIKTVWNAQDLWQRINIALEENKKEKIIW